MITKLDTNTTNNLRTINKNPKLEKMTRLEFVEGAISNGIILSSYLIRRAPGLRTNIEEKREECINSIKGAKVLVETSEKLSSIIEKDGTNSWVKLGENNLSLKEKAGYYHFRINKGAKEIKGIVYKMYAHTNDLNLLSFSNIQQIVKKLRNEGINCNFKVAKDIVSDSGIYNNDKLVIHLSDKKDKEKIENILSGILGDGISISLGFDTKDFSYSQLLSKITKYAKLNGGLELSLKETLKGIRLGSLIMELSDDKEQIKSIKPYSISNLVDNSIKPHSHS